MPLELPTTRTAQIALHEGWCVVTRIQPGVLQSLDDARENLAAMNEVRQGIRRPALVDISVAAPLTPEVRHFYTGKELDEAFVAQALVIEATPFGRTMGDIYLRVARPAIPTRLFTDEREALAWLRTFLPSPPP